MYGLDMPRYDTVSAFGSASAPGAGGAVATIASGSLPNGYYEIVVDVRLDGTLGTADRENFELRRGSTAVTRILVADVADAAAGTVRLYLNLSGSQALSVNATGASTGGSVYAANIIANRLV